MRVTAPGFREPPESRERGTGCRNIYYEFFSPWGGSGGWWAEGASLKIIKSIWYGLLWYFEIFERDIVWLRERGGREGGCIYTVKREP